MLIASTILIAGILVAGCTQDASSTSTQSTGNTAQSTEQGQAVGGDSGTTASSTTPDRATNIGDKPQFNQSAGPQGTLPAGMQMNGTRPSGTPPGGWQMNGTRPSGTPPDGWQMNGTPPSGP